MTIRITAKKDGFRRCGVAHPSTATVYPSDRFGKKELDILKAEPMLVVEEIADEKEKKGKKDGE
jgi:hypothetical protein